MTGASSEISVVICDDHLILAEGLSAILSGESDIVVSAVTGSVAALMAAVDIQNPDVVLIDYGLPDGDGVSATRALKQTHPRVQVVMLTAYSDQEVLLAALKAGCSGYLTKHSGTGKVSEAVRQAAAGEAVITASLLHQLLPQLKATERGVGYGLTARERGVVELLAEGVPGHFIAERLYLSNNTVRNHVQSILNKLGAHSRLQAVAIAVQEGIIRRP